LADLTWKVVAESTDTRVHAGTPAAASRGDDAAVAYVETTDTVPTTARVVLQRFDARAERLGTLLVLASNPDQNSAITLASDGAQYAACWNAAQDVRCSLVDASGTVQENALALPGYSPTIVASSDGWVIAYAVGDTTLRLQPLDPQLEPAGTPVDLKRSTHFSYSKAGALLTSTPSGFALVGAGSDDEHDGLLRLGADLKVLGAAIPLGRDFWFYGQMIASDNRAAVSLSAPYGSYLLLLDAERVTAELSIAGGGKAGIDEAFLLMDGTIGAAWLTRDQAVRQRSFAPGHDSDIGLATRTDSLLGLPEEGTESYQQLLSVADQTLLVARANRYGYLAPAAIRVAALKF
jgi:hypothetical protein